MDNYAPGTILRTLYVNTLTPAVSTMEAAELPPASVKRWRSQSSMRHGQQAMDSTFSNACCNA